MKKKDKKDRFDANRMYEQRGDLSRKQVEAITGCNVDRRNYEGKGKPKLRRGVIR